jgi:phage I-like protein
MKLLRSFHSVELSPGSPPQWVHLLPLGSPFHGRDGRGPYSLPDAQAAQAVIAATLAYQAGADLPIDYDHQSLWSRENGQPAPAAGWVKELAARADGIWGRVEWTPKAAELLREKAYRYLSPVFMHDEGGAVTRLACAALSNLPNLELAAVASQLPGGTTVNLLQALVGLFKLPAETTAEAVSAHCQKFLAGLATLATALGLPGEADPEKLAAHAQKLDATGKTNLAALAKALGAAETSTMEQLAAHAQTLTKPGEKQADGKPDPSQYVPMSQFNLVNDRLKLIESERVAGLVDEAIKAGKVPPANRDWALGYASREEAEFRKMLTGMPAIVAPGASGPSGQPPQGKDGLSSEDMAVCSQLGISAEEFKKTRAQEKEGM